MNYIVPLHPDNNPDDPSYDLNLQAERVKEAYEEGVKEAAGKIKLALEAYVFVAEQYAYGPIFNLGGAALGRLLTKADDLLRLASEARALATRLRALEAKAQTVIGRLKARLIRVEAGSDEERYISSSTIQRHL